MFKPSDDPTSKHRSDIALLLDKGIENDRGQQKSRTYLGGSRWGEECERKLGYEFHGQVPDPGRGFEGKTLRVFDAGHDGERRMARWLRLAGFDLLTERPDGSQFGWKGAYRQDGTHRLGLNVDGVIVGGPSIQGLSYPAMWESKTMNDKKFKEVMAGGLKKANPVYYGQINSYMATLGEVHNGLFTAENKNTSEIYCEIIPLDARVAQECIDRAVRVVESKSPEELPRIAKDRTFFKCKWCSFQDSCFAERPKEATVAPTTAPWLL